MAPVIAPCTVDSIKLFAWFSRLPNKFFALVISACVTSGSPGLLGIYVISPFNNLTFRVAGTAELAGWNHDVRIDRIKPLRRWVRQNTFVKDKRPEMWACLRPMTPNMLPVAKKIAGLWVNSVAGHLCWTMGMALAEKIAKEI